MNRLLTLIVDGLTAYAHGCAEIWDAKFEGIQRALDDWASRPTAAHPVAPAITDDEPHVPPTIEDHQSGDPTMELYLLGLLDHHSSPDLTDADLSDNSSTAFDDSSMLCNSLDMFSDTTCMFDDSSTGGCE